MPNSTTPKLSDTQLVILSSASQRDDGLAVLPTKLKGGAARAAVTKLLGLGFLKEIRVKREEPAWRTDEEEKPVGLKITKSGCAAIGLEAEGQNEEQTPSHPKSRRKPKEASAKIEASREPRAGSKQALIIALLQRKTGATLDDLVEATGWLPHTTRAAMTGLRRKGYTIGKAKSPKGKTVYRIVAGERAAPAAEQVG